jgi:hypothetical protein
MLSRGVTLQFLLMNAVSGKTTGTEEGTNIDESRECMCNLDSELPTGQRTIRSA